MRVSQYETREQSREDKGEDGKRKNATASVESKREGAKENTNSYDLTHTI